MSSSGTKTSGMNGHTNGINGHDSPLIQNAVKQGVDSRTNKEITEFLNAIMKMCVNEGYSKVVSKQTKVVNFKKPAQLGKVFDFQVEEEPVDNKTLLSICEKVFDYSVKTGHPHFFNQLYAGVDPYGFAGSVITDVLNPSMYTYEVTPVFILMEKSVIKQVCEIVGYPNGDGTLSPGGSYSNMLGMNLARYNKFPNVKEVGMRNLPRMVAFTNEQCHYSNKKNASLMGIGTDDLIAIKSEQSGRMDVNDLKARVEEVIAQGAVPFCVVATSGTTVLGAYDPLVEIADVCKQHNIWLHCDAAWGGGALLSKKHKHLFNGVERADSIAWNMHKMAMAPQQCCFFVSKHPEVFSGAHSLHVPYLFQQDKTLYDASYDVGSKVIQCGRKVDIFKFWLMWKALGRRGLEARIDKAFDNARHLAELCKQREGFRLLQEPECTNVCFWFIPKRMRSMAFDLSNEDYCRQLAAVAPQIKERMTLEGSLMCGYQPVGDLPNFFRMIVINDLVGHADMKFVLDTIEKLGNDL